MLLNAEIPSTGQPDPTPPPVIGLQLGEENGRRAARKMPFRATELIAVPAGITVGLPPPFPLQGTTSPPCGAIAVGLIRNELSSAKGLQVVWLPKPSVTQVGSVLARAII